MKLSLIPILIATAILTGGCSSTSVVDPGTGKTQRLPGERDWAMFVQSTEWNLSSELRGELPGAGFKSWREFWAWRRTAIQKYSKDATKELNYIVQRRRELGLAILE